MSAYDEYQKDKHNIRGDLAEKMMLAAVNGHFNPLHKNLANKYAEAQKRTLNDPKFQRELRKAQADGLRAASEKYNLDLVQIATVDAVRAAVKRLISEDVMIAAAINIVSPTPVSSGQILAAVAECLAAETSMPKGWEILAQYEKEAEIEHEAEKLAREGVAPQAPAPAPASADASAEASN